MVETGKPSDHYLTCQVANTTIAKDWETKTVFFNNRYIEATFVDGRCYVLTCGHTKRELGSAIGPSCGGGDVLVFIGWPSSLAF